MKRTAIAWVTTITFATLAASGCVIVAGDDTANDDANATEATTTSADPDAGSSTGEGADGASTTASVDETTASADETTAADAPDYPDYAGEGTLRLLADGDDLPGHESLASTVNATESSLDPTQWRVAAYFEDSGNRVILHFPQEAPGEYVITEVDGGGAVVDVLLNTDATGLEQRIEGVLASGTIRLDELDVTTGRARAVWVGVMTPASASGLQAELAVAGALDVTVEVLP